MVPYKIDDQITHPLTSSVEVTIDIDGQKQWLFFTTPELLASVGDFVAGTQARLHLGERHMIVVSELSEIIIDKVLRSLHASGELLSRMLPLVPHAPQRSLMADFLFVFGYESPEDWRTNQKFGTDAESSSAVWVSALNEEAALSAGGSYAERWVHDLFSEKGGEGYPGWCACDYAHWIEREPLKRFSGHALDLLERIQG